MPQDIFEAAETGKIVAKPAFKREAERLREQLLTAQKALAGSKTAVAVLVGGVEGAGKAEFVNLLLSWLDARGVEVHALGRPSDEEAERPPFWRFWRGLPPKGKLAVYLGSWYTGPIVDRALKRSGRRAFEAELARIAAFEAMLAAEGVRLVKLWFHLSKKAQRRRLEDLESDAATRWRVTDQDWRFHKRYGRFRKVSAAAMEKTSTGAALWRVVDAEDPRHRDISGIRRVLEVLREPFPEEAQRVKPALPKPRRPNLISRLDMTRKLAEDEYEDRVGKLQGRLNRLSRRLWEERRSLTLVFEGPDAAGKGGAIRRLTQAMDFRSTRVISTAAPSDEERARPYLWRFWRDVPRLGRTTIYDRSWYGRVLVERLEGFCAREDWQRAFGEINAFEEQLAEAGTILVKFWLGISSAEQLRRFKDRELTPYKQHKIGEEDWRNRAKWDAYEAAAVEMIARTSTPRAPWVLVEADDKRWARVRVLEAVVEGLKAGL